LAGLGGSGRRRGWVLVVVLFGVVSLFADMSYEGLRGVIPAEVVSAVGLAGLIGVGDLVAYALRPLSGVVVEAVGGWAGYWAAVVLGYSLVPVGVYVALWGGAWLAAGYWVERLGKALRGPARDALLSRVAPRGRRGLVFGIHEAMDQVGAVAGPLLGALVVAGRAPPWLLAVPGALGVPALLVAAAAYPRDAAPPPGGVAAVAESARRSLRAVLLVALLGSLAPTGIAVAHLARVSGAPEAWVPVVYAAVMLGDAAAAVPLGALYDRSPRASVAALAVAGAAGAAAVLYAPSSLAAAALAGVVEAGFETVARAMARGATGYGLLGLARGVAAAVNVLLYSAVYALLHPAAPSL